MSFLPDPFAGFSDEARSQTPPRPLSLQDQETAAALAAAAQLVNHAAADESLATLLEGQGYNAEELQAGVTLHAAAEEVFAMCQQALGDLDRAQAAYDEAWVQAREDYVEFRWIARREYPDASTQEALQVTGVISDEVHEFIAQAAASYRAAQQLKSAAALAAQGFGPERIRSSLAELRLVAQLELALQARQSGARRQTEERDLAIAMLNLWMRDFERAARIVLRGVAHPPLTKWLGRGRSLRVGRAPQRGHSHRMAARFRLRFPRSRS